MWFTTAISQRDHTTSYRAEKECSTTMRQSLNTIQLYVQLPTRDASHALVSQSFMSPTTALVSMWACNTGLHRQWGSWWHNIHYCVSQTARSAMTVTSRKKDKERDALWKWQWHRETYSFHTLRGGSRTAITNEVRREIMRVVAVSAPPMCL